MRTAKYIIAIVAICALAGQACILVVDSEGTLTVFNDSDYVIEEVRIADRGDAHFGPDLTGRDAIFPGESLVVKLTCDEYDVFVADELGTECVLYGVDVCIGGTHFHITNSLLDRCSFARAP